ncbi:MAG TPA: DUF4139 domain-containing protein [Candidatus Cybelea sp.]
MLRLSCTILASLAIVAPIALAADPTERTSTVAERRLINLTVYNGGTALIRDRRVVRLEPGLNRLAWRDVSADMDATSALLEPVGGTDTIAVREQNFDYDLMSSEALLRKYVGRDVTVVHEPRFAGDRETRETARVLSVDDGVVLQYRGGIETGVRGHILFPVSVNGFRDRPTLVIDLDSSQDASETLDLSYLTRGMSWRADYVGVVSADQTRLSLNGLVTLSNTSGESYEDAHLQLVAGNVNVVEPPEVVDRALRTIGRVTTNAGPSVEQENYFEYHLYSFARQTTILNDQTKQLTLLSAQGIPVRESLELRGSPGYYRSAEPDIGDRLPVGAYLTFENRGGELGIPLPGGVVRLYKNDSHNQLQFLGSDLIDHTPRNERVRLHVGDAFDVTARKKQTDFHFLSPCSTSSSYRIVLANAKSTAQNVLVVEPIPAQWQITQENIQYVKSSASTASWDMRVPADGQSTLTYTADVTWCFD